MSFFDHTAEGHIRDHRYGTFFDIAHAGPARQVQGVPLRLGAAQGHCVCRSPAHRCCLPGHLRERRLRGTGPDRLALAGFKPRSLRRGRRGRHLLLVSRTPILFLYACREADKFLGAGPTLFRPRSGSSGSGPQSPLAVTASRPDSSIASPRGTSTVVRYPWSDVESRWRSVSRRGRARSWPRRGRARMRFGFSSSKASTAGWITNQEHRHRSTVRDSTRIQQQHSAASRIGLSPTFTCPQQVLASFNALVLARTLGQGLMYC